MVFGLFPRPYSPQNLFGWALVTTQLLIATSASLTPKLSNSVSSLSLNVSIPQCLTWALCISTQIFPIRPSMSMSSAQIFSSSSTYISNAICKSPMGCPAITSDSIPPTHHLPCLSLSKLSPCSDFPISTRDAKLLLAIPKVLERAYLNSYLAKPFPSCVSLNKLTWISFSEKIK